MSLLLNMLSRLVITFLPRSKRLLISWLQSPSAVILEPPKINQPLFPLFPHLFPMTWWDQRPWSSFSECWALSQLFHSPLSLSCIEEGNGNPLQCSCLENPRDGGAWWAAIYRVTQSWTWLKWLSSSSSKQRVLKSRDITLPTKVRLVKAMVSPVVMYGCASWIIKKAERRRIDAFELWCWRRLIRVPWTVRRSNQSILKEISPGSTLEGLMLKLQLQYFGHLMRRADSS